jgi:phosphate starvation-inducible PhoH-like protein
MMAKKSRKRDVVVDKASEEEIIIHELEKNHTKQLFCNFRIYNKFVLNEVHKTFLDLCLHNDTKMVFVDGPAGSGKSYLSVFAALKMLQNKEINQIIYIRSVVESASRSMGYLKGDSEEKLSPYLGPLLEKLNELIGNKSANDLMNKEFVKCLPVNFVRGLTFRDSIVIIDESQNLDYKELTTVLTRFGENTKYIIIGDSFQSDIGNKSGFVKIREAFNDAESVENGIHNFAFSENEVVRSKILKFIVRKLETPNI